MLLLDWMAAESHTLAPYADNASKCPLSTMPARSARLAATGGSAAAATFCGAAVRARRSARMEHGQHCCAVAARCVPDNSVRLEFLRRCPSMNENKLHHIGRYTTSSPCEKSRRTHHVGIEVW